MGVLSGASGPIQKAGGGGGGGGGSGRGEGEGEGDWRGRYLI